MSKTIQLHDKEFVPFIEANAIHNAIKELGVKLSADYKDKKPLFIGILNGCFLFAADIVREFDGACEVSFLKLASYEGVKSTGEVSELIGINESIKDRHVVILEDIIDTGNTLQKIHESLESMSPASVEIVALLYKPDAYEKNFPIKYTAFSVGNEFLVGYGLDYDGLGRNLKDIYVIKE